MPPKFHRKPPTEAAFCVSGAVLSSRVRLAVPPACPAASPINPQQHNREAMPSMTEPASSAAAGAAGWKLIGGAAGAAGIGAGLSAMIVMLMLRPRSAREWTVGLTTTLLGSMTGGSFVIVHFGLATKLFMMDGAELYVGLMATIGIAFACGLPAWALTRWIFTFLERRKDSDIAEIAAEVRKQLKDATP